jgi:hypothetical protein
MDKNSKCLLTFREEGALVQATGIFETKEILGGVEVIRKTFAKNVKVPGESHCTTMLSEAFVQHATSNEGMPLGITKFQWSRMSDGQRLRSHLREIANGKPFTYELI